MSSIFQQLYDNWSPNDVQISISDLQGGKLTPRWNLDWVIEQYLLVPYPLAVTTETLPQPTGNTWSFQGTVNVFAGGTRFDVTVTLDVLDGITDVTFELSLPQAWTLGEVFSPMNTAALSLLSFTNAQLVLTTRDVDSPHAESPVSQMTFAGTIPIAAGPLAPLAILGITPPSAEVTLSGPFDTSVIASPIVMPLVQLRGSIPALPVSIDHLTLSSPELSILSFIESPVDQYLWLILAAVVSASDPTFSVDVTCTLGSNSVLSLDLASSRSSPLTLEDLFGVLGGSEIAGMFPSQQFTDLFSSVELLDLHVLVALSPVSVMSISVMLGAATTSPFYVGPYEIKDLFLRFGTTFMSPSFQSLYFGGTLELPKTSPPFELDLEVGMSGGTLAFAATGKGSITLGEIIKAAGVDPPASFPAFTFTDVGVIFQVGQATDFTLYGSGGDNALEVLGHPVEIEIAFYFDSQSSTYLLSGSLLVSDELFSVTLQSTPTGPTLSGAWLPNPSGVVDLQEIVNGLGLSLPPIPDALDLTLTGASITYGVESGNLVVGAQSTYGAAVFAGVGTASTSVAHCAILAIDQSFNLSDLPLVGQALGSLDTLSVENILVIIGSGLDETAVAALNEVLRGYPSIPTGVTLGEVTLFAEVNLGEGVQNIVVDLGGGSPSTTSTAEEALFALAVAGTTPSAPPIEWIPIQKSFGPVTIQKIGIEYVSASPETIWFDLDASLAFGPFAVTLVGLGIGARLADFAPSFALQGFGISYSNPPLKVSGLFANLALPGSAELAFGGEVLVSTTGFTLSALGFYGTVGDPPVTSMFIFVDVQRQFGGPPAFFVTGIAGGFGFNSSLTIPAIADVATFPFIEWLAPANALGVGTQPQTVIEDLMAPPGDWVVPQAGTFWAAAGLQFTSFQLVDSVALLVLQNTDGVVITLLGTSTAVYPQGATGSQRYASLTLDLEAVFKPDEGSLTIEGLLTPSSYVIVPACAVTGGFSYDLWFGSNAHAGDWVLTLGGYNASFTPPSYYPSVPRLGFNWAQGNATITGSAYLALTPAVFMAGCELEANYSAGSLDAWFDASADMVMRWTPFYFDAQISLSLGASYTIDLLFTKVRISISLSCSLELWGPPTGGSVTVQYWVISFTYSFGTPQQNASTPLSWTDILAMIPSDGGSVLLTLQPIEGVLSTGSSGTPGAAWIVRPSEFAFTTTTPVPATSVLFNGASVSTTLSPGATFDVHPLDWSAVTAELSVEITSDSGGSIDPFEIEVLYANVPMSLWGSPPETNGQPQVPNGNEQLVPNQIIGITATVEKPPDGFSAGPIPTQLLETLPLTPGGTLPYANVSPLSAPVASDTTTNVIASTIAANASRASIFAALQSLGYAPSSNDSMELLASDPNGWLSAEPLIFTLSPGEVAPVQP